MHRGYIKLWRKVFDNPYMRKPENLHLWVTLLFEATHKEVEYVWNGRKIILQPGQFITGRKKLSTYTGLSESMVERSLKTFEIEQQIEQQKSSTSRLITIINWDKYQNTEQQIEQPVNNERTTSEQPLNTKQEFKNAKNNTNTRFVKPSVEEINAYCSERKNGIDGQDFFDHYETVGWVYGKDKKPIKNWQAAVRTWEKIRHKKLQEKTNKTEGYAWA